MYYGEVSIPVPWSKQGFATWGSLQGMENGHCPKLRLHIAGGYKFLQLSQTISS